jgi:hypothetical protein
MTPKAKESFKKFCAEQGMDQEDINACKWYAAGMIEFADWMLEQRKWVSVQDRLPEEGGRYWCYVKDINELGTSYFQWNCAYNEKEKRFSDSTLTNGENVTHWQPLSEPPKTVTQ